MAKGGGGSRSAGKRLQTELTSGARRASNFVYGPASQYQRPAPTTFGGAVREGLRQSLVGLPFNELSTMNDRRLARAALRAVTRQANRIRNGR